MVILVPGRTDGQKRQDLILFGFQAEYFFFGRSRERERERERERKKKQFNTCLSDDVNLESAGGW